MTVAENLYRVETHLDYDWVGLDSAPPNAAPPCDVNGDCQVNILDLTQAAGNLGLCSNCP